MDRLVVSRSDRVVILRKGGALAVAQRNQPPVVEIQRSGIPGAKGVAGEGAEIYTHSQVSPLPTWTVNHNLGYYPSSVLVKTVGGVEILADVVHLNTNQVQIEFAVPTSGTAVVS